MTATPDRALRDLLHHEWTRRDGLAALLGGGLAAMTGLSAGPARATALAADGVVRIGYLPITDAASLLVAQARGLFEAQGLKVEQPFMARSWASLVEAFAAGRVNVVHLLKPIPVWMRYANGVKVKVLAWAHTNGSGVVLGAHSRAREFGELGGARIAVPFWYSMHNVVLQLALREAGLVPVIKDDRQPVAPNEVALQVLPPPEMTAALAARKIDGFIVAEPFNALAEMRAGARMLRFTGDIWRQHPCCVVTVHEALVERNPEFAQKVTNAIVDAQLWLNGHKAEAARLLSAEGANLIPLPNAVVAKAMTDYGDAYRTQGAIRNPGWEGGRIDFQPYPYPSATRLIVEALKHTVVAGETAFLRQLDPAHVAQDLVDDRFVRAALQARPAWRELPGVAGLADPFTREEMVRA
ncbi:ABC transporter substrate-binding protein [Arenimonas sp.]|uniref:ABC transporter substrate-binding protein n=1 Tax=Arenimonas sp. TaxID=1872635 RepID=UPI001DA94AD1|nr:ABC transporter substrate-binding protein [Arenimonas sp.]MBX9749669.1 ABC transporter substrate-binding protein [Roseococcus sp.]